MYESEIDAPARLVICVRRQVPDAYRVDGEQRELKDERIEVRMDVVSQLHVGGRLAGSAAVE